MNKTALRIITTILAAALLFSLFSGTLSMIVRAAATPGTTGNILTADTKISKTLTRGKVSTGVAITFYFWDSSLSDLPTTNSERTEYDYRQLLIPADSSFSWGANTKLVVTRFRNEGNHNYYRGVLSGVTYNGGSSQILQFYVNDEEYFETPISNKYFRDETKDGDAPTSDIVVQSVNVKDAADRTLEKVTEDTGPFTVEITFYDMGLRDESKASLEAARIYAFVTAATGFKTLSGTGGTVEVLTSAAEFPCFKVTFKDIRSDGASNLLGFRIQYDLTEYESSVKGEASAVLFQIASDGDDDELASLKPNVIVQSYSYGEEAIVAGEEFDLDLEFINTSSTLSVENVVMTITPGNGFVIAASSNTVYVPSLSPGETHPYSVALRAAASGNTSSGTAGAQTDYSITIKFEYQYLSKKEYPIGTTEIKIAIPVVQLDRFSIDEITDYTAQLMAYEEGYITVPIINKGKSPVYNISAEVRGPENMEFAAPAVHYGGQLDASKTGNIDISIMIHTPGEFYGEVIVWYEDEDMNQKQLTASFSILVTEPYVPQPEMPPDSQGEAENAGMQPLQILFCVTGGLMMAVPIGLYFVKRVKARGSEDIDESF